MWRRDRHLFHGRLLAAGVTGGATDLDTYDVACLVVAELHRLAEATGFVYDQDRVKKLRDLIELGESRPDAAIAELERMREEMARTSEPSTQLEEQPAADNETQGEDRQRKLMEVANAWGAKDESSGA